MQDENTLFYVQGKMTPADRTAFEAQMQKDAGLRAEVTVLQAARKAMADAPAERRAGGWDRLSAAIDQETRPAANDNRPLRFSLLQAACIAAVAAISVQAYNSFSVSPAPDGFAPVSVETQGAVLRVTFAPDAPIAEITALVGALGGQFIDGPSAIGLFRLSFEDEKSRAAALAELRRRPALVSEVLEN